VRLLLKAESSIQSVTGGPEVFDGTSETKTFPPFVQCSVLRYIRFSVKWPASKSSLHSRWRLLLSLVCIALILAVGTIQAVHVHPNGDISHTDCALCLTAHAAVQVATPSVTLHVTPVISFVQAFVSPARTPVLSTFALFTRPPPVNAAAV
jgi:hypothetical protein